MLKEKIKTSRLFILIASAILAFQGILLALQMFMLSSFSVIAYNSFRIYNPMFMSLQSSYSTMILGLAIIYIAIAYSLFKIQRDNDVTTFTKQKWIFFALGCVFLVSGADLLSILVGLLLVASFAFIMGYENDQYPAKNKSSKNKDAEQTKDNKTTEDTSKQNSEIKEQNAEDKMRTVTFYPKDSSK